MEWQWGRELGLSLADGVLVVAASVGIYVAVIVYTRIAGQRSVASFATFDYVVHIAIGAVVGRVVLVRTSLLAGVLGLGVLFGIQATVGFLRNQHGLGRLVDNPPVLVVACGEILDDSLRRAHLSRDDLREKLRLSGVHRLSDVRAVVMERGGGVSVIREGEVDEWLLEDLPEGVRARG